MFYTNYAGVVLQHLLEIITSFLRIILNQNKPLIIFLIHMNKREFYKQQTEFVYCYFLRKFIEENIAKFYGVALNQIYFIIITDEYLVLEFTEFIAQKMYLLTYDANEAKKVKEVFISELN